VLLFPILVLPGESRNVDAQRSVAGRHPAISMTGIGTFKKRLLASSVARPKLPCARHSLASRVTLRTLANDCQPPGTSHGHSGSVIR